MIRFALVAAVALVAFFDYQEFYPRSFAGQVKESAEQALTLHPALGLEGSLLRQKFIQRQLQAVASRDPVLLQPDWPEKLADECAQNLLGPAPRIPAPIVFPAGMPAAAVVALQQRHGHGN